MEEKMREILEKYSLEIKHLYRGRGAWMCETEQGLKLLRPYMSSPQRLEWEMQIKERLKAMGCYYIDTVIYNSEGEYMTKDENENYVLTDWYIGKECNTRDRHEIVKVVAFMADLHNKMANLDGLRNIEEMNHTENIYKEMCRRLREFKTIRNYIAHKKQKNDFDRMVWHVLGQYEEDGKRAIQMLLDMDYPSMYQNACEKIQVCHGDFHQHNILMLNEGIGIVRFDQMRVDLSVYDLYTFMRKVLEKNRWNPSLGIAMMDTYRRIHPLDYRSMRCLYSMLLFPEKFWKIVNRYHNTRKSWMSAQNMSKLDKVIREERLKSHFMEVFNEMCEKRNSII